MLICAFWGVFGEEEKVFRVVGDSYLEAFKASHVDNSDMNEILDKAVKISDREYSEPYPYPATQYGQPEPAYNYGMPQTLQKYGPPLPQ